MIAGWNTHSINDCCEILDSQRVPLNAEQRSIIPGDIPYYGANGIQGYINQYLFDEDLILMAEDGGNFDQFATRPIAYKISGKSWVNNHAHILKAKNGFNQDFVFYSIVHKNILYFIQGGTRSKLNQSDLKSIILQIPNSETEQSTIATILTTIDQAIEKTEQLIAKYERIKTGLMQDLLTRGIDEQGNIRSEETHEFKDSVLGRIPKEWDVVSFSSVSDVIDSLHKTPSYSDNGYSMVRGTEIYDGFLDDSILENAPKVSPNVYSEFTEKYCPQSGDILMTRVGSYGVTCLVDTKTPFCLGQNTVVINAKSVDSFFLYYVSKAEYISRQIELNLAGSSQKTLSLGHIRKLKLGLPKDEDEQERISETIFNADKSIISYRSQLRKLQKNKTGLMQDLLTGKVRVDALMNQIKETL
ncbi:MAG: restriction endonuclease subunit S [Saprospiraceae bacterium]